MVANTHDIGDRPKIQAKFKDADTGALKDPTAVYLYIKDPTGNVDGYEYGVDVDLKKESTGIYYLELSIDEAGIWYYRWKSTGIAQAAEEGTFTARTQIVGSS